MVVTEQGLEFVLKAQDITFLGGVLAIVIMSLIEAGKSKYKPWTWILQKIGKVLNQPVTDKLDDIETRIGTLEKDNVRQDKERLEDKALMARRRIIGAADELRQGLKHSQEWFNSVLEDCSFYEDYCEANKKTFHNEKAKASIKFIRDTYDECIRENKFQ